MKKLESFISVLVLASVITNCVCFVGYMGSKSLDVNKGIQRIVLGN